MNEKQFLRLKTLAELGDAAAQYSLGMLYLKGRGKVKRDYPKAMKWLNWAAERGSTSAFHALGTIYLSGYAPRKNGVKVVQLEPDFVKAYMWFGLDEAAKISPGEVPSILLAKMTPEQISAGQGLIRKWKRAPIKNELVVKRTIAELKEKSVRGDIESKFLLGFIYNSGSILGAQDRAEAYFWFCLTAHQNPEYADVDHLQKITKMWLSAKQIGAVEKRVDAWMRKHSNSSRS